MPSSTPSSSSYRDVESGVIQQARHKTTISSSGGGTKRVSPFVIIVLVLISLGFGTILIPFAVIEMQNNAFHTTINPAYGAPTHPSSSRNSNNYNVNMGNLGGTMPDITYYQQIPGVPNPRQQMLQSIPYTNPNQYNNVVNNNINNNNLNANPVPRVAVPVPVYNNPPSQQQQMQQPQMQQQQMQQQQLQQPTPQRLPPRAPPPIQPTAPVAANAQPAVPGSPTPPPGFQARNYVHKPNTDVDLHDIKQVPGLSINELKNACDSTPGCVGFNSAGWLKKDAEPQGRSTVDLYIAGGPAPAGTYESRVPKPIVYKPPPPAGPPVLAGADAIRSGAVKDAMSYAWNAYSNRCFGQDELLPVSNQCGNWLGLGLTIVDALDTLKIMGLEQEYNKAKDWAVNSLRTGPPRSVSFFETVIRMLGGLLSAHSLDPDARYITKAVELANRLVKAFETPTGLPRAQINLKSLKISNPGWTGKASLLAEIGTVQMEFSYLAHHSGDRSYYDKAQKVFDHLDKMKTLHEGLYPLYISADTGQFTNNKVSFGAMGDSFYEYELKMWLLTSKNSEQYARMYLETARSMIEHVVTEKGGYTFLADLNANTKALKMDHLACFAGGMLALGVITNVVQDKTTAAEHLRIGGEIARTCYESYKQQATGIGPEWMDFSSGKLNGGDWSYNLRPETVETLFLMWRATHDIKYRNWGWDIFMAIEEHCKQPKGGYAGLKDVRTPGKFIDKQESFFLAETLKYLYLLFSDDDVIPLDGPGAYVFNTEAHPLKTFTPNLW